MKPPFDLVVGIGNRYRGDDAFGCLVAAELAQLAIPGLKCIEHDGEPATLIDCWQGADKVLLVDAVSSGGEPGEIFRFDLGHQPLPEGCRIYSSHAFGVAEAIELARALGRLPAQIVFIGVEGECFHAGASLSASLAAAKPTVIAKVLDWLRGTG